MTRYSLLILFALAACTSSTPGADTTRSAAADTTATSPAPAPAPVAVDTPVAARPDSTPGSAPAARQDSTAPSRPRMKPRPPRPVPSPIPPDAAGEVDQATIDRLRQEAKALVHVDGCRSSGECAVLPLGERACGGPEEYLVYCPKTTDVRALQRKAAELARAQKAFNEKNGIMSTCEFRTPPKAVLVGGSCRAATTGVPGAPAVRLP